MGKGKEKSASKQVIEVMIKTRFAFKVSNRHNRSNLFQYKHENKS